MLIIGPGQQLVEMSFFARHNSVTGIDLDVIPRHPSVREYLRIFRNNGSIRTLKTMARKAMGYDRALRREAERAGLTVDSDPAVVAMDAAAMTFPDDSFNCVFLDFVLRAPVGAWRCDPAGGAGPAAGRTSPRRRPPLHERQRLSRRPDLGGRRDSIPPWSRICVRNTVPWSSPTAT